MRGEVLHYDQTQGFGFIAGADGNRYTFAREDLRGSTVPGKGTQIEFQPSGSQARDVFAIHALVGVQQVAAKPAPSVPQFGRRGSDQQTPSFNGMAAEAGPTSTGLWSYFWRAITTNYASFRARARRKEYWGYYLFWAISAVALAAVGFGIDGALGRLDAGMEEPIAGFALPGLFLLATLLPSIAVTIRRIHDLGLSGWFYLLILLPYVGGLIIFVFTLIPSQKHENKWGPVPVGVRVPPPYVPAA
ncbi:DUF805 domain-containing protein [Aminobacter carboxidus]|uniref:DUF805 domain-containing protein n=1 Tax=Aminobacter carboxidus TaxID=376165 RepID=A0A8E1WE41_9HYPH|nr:MULTISPECIES: DUF805 domain-containing protein [Aminobacter carboxidus group]MBB6465896.1 uncharacterized membrane protein YhaH (DUF805 family)/cold shock CspA family protein [Aminobacter lissarensis]MBE1204382.1 DUF805 domain-containing protein [Aminobacter carboxidus]